MASDSTLERTRDFWQVASTFPANKEEIYPEHAMAQEFSRHRGQRVLEYGCGGGSDALSYLRRGNYVYLTDVVQRNLEVARERIASAHLQTSAQFFFLEKNDQIPLPANFVDVASSHGVIHHIADPTPVVAALAAIIRPKGALYMMLYTEHLWARFQDTINDLTSKHGITPEEAFGWCTDGEGCPYARAYTEEQGIEMLRAAGMTVTSTMLYANDDFRTFRAIKEKSL